MPFFEGAYDFEVNGGNFYDIRGNQNNYAKDSSVTVGGTNNKLDMRPDHSQQDNRSYNMHASAYTAAAYGPVQGQTSTYPGYGHVPPPTAHPYHPAMQPPTGEQPDYQMLMQYHAWYYSQYMAYYAAMNSQYQGNQQQQAFASQQQQFSFSASQHQQSASGASRNPADESQHPQAAQPTSAAHPAITEGGEPEDPEIANLRQELEGQHLEDDLQYVYVPQAVHRPSAQS